MKKSFIVVSGQRPDKDYTNELMQVIRDTKLGAKQVVGSWQGGKETSFVAVFDRKDMEQDSLAAHITSMCLYRFEQDVVLHVDENRRATLGDASGHVESIGQFVEVGEGEAQTLAGYTFDPIDGRYWAVK